MSTTTVTKNVFPLSLEGRMSALTLDREAAEALAQRVRSESWYRASVHVNNRGRAFVNVTDPGRPEDWPQSAEYVRHHPFTIRDESDWKAPRKPKGKKQEQEIRIKKVKRS